LSEPKIAVPATMTLLPKQTGFKLTFLKWAKAQTGHTRFGTDINCLGTYTPIHFDIFIRKPCAELCDLGNAALHKLLAAAAWGLFDLSVRKGSEKKSPHQDTRS
jgi:hypothetical protein